VLSPRSVRQHAVPKGAQSSDGSVSSGFATLSREQAARDSCFIAGRRAATLRGPHSNDTSRRLVAWRADARRVLPAPLTMTNPHVAANADLLGGNSLTHALGRKSGCAAGFTPIGIIVLGIGLVTTPVRAQVNVLTYHNDPARTGQNLQET